METKKIIVFGNQQICIDILKILQDRNDVVVSCCVGSELSRDKDFGYASVSNYCNSVGLDFYNPDSLTDAFLETIKKYNPDLFLSVYYRNIFHNNFIEVPPMGVINFHPSLLPKYRGPAPTMWALLNDEKEVGMTMHYIDTGIDTGDIIDQSIVEIPPDISGFDLNNLVMNQGSILLERSLAKILSGTNKRESQDHTKASYYGSFRGSIRNIDWSTTSQHIYNQVRALTRPYAGAKSKIDDQEVIIWSVLPVTLSRNLNGPGKIVDILKNGDIIVSTVDGYIKVTDFEFTENPDFAVNKKSKFNL